MPEGQGKILIAPGAPPAEYPERKAAGASSGFEKGRGLIPLMRSALAASIALSGDVV
jgi:hypothetical protein